jgi:hypothetical protein
MDDLLLMIVASARPTRSPTTLAMAAVHGIRQVTILLGAGLRT